MNRRFREFWARVEWVIELYRLKRVGLYFVGLVGLWLLAALVLWSAEGPHAAAGERFGDFWSCLWSGTVFLVSGIEFEPKTFLGKAAAVLVMLSGLGMLGLLGTSILAAVVESVGLAARVRRKPRLSRLEDHIVLCGWSPKGDAIVREIHSEQFEPRQRRPVVIVDPAADRIVASDRRAYRNVWAVVGDPVQRGALEEADAARAHGIVVLAPEAADDQAADARTILISLALQAACPGVHTCVEVRDRRSIIHFERTAVKELVCIRDVACRLIAHAAHKHHLTDFFAQLLTVSAETNEVYALPVPGALLGATFVEAQRAFLRSELSDVIPIGVQRAFVKMRDGEPLRDRMGAPIVGSMVTLNPPCELGGGAMRTRFFSRRLVDEARVSRTHKLERGDRLVVIARAEPDLSKLSALEDGETR
ncbi:MAG: TrkA-related ion transporter [Planctomycetota bacterium]